MGITDKILIKAVISAELHSLINKRNELSREGLPSSFATKIIYKKLLTTINYEPKNIRY